MTLPICSLGDGDYTSKEVTIGCDNRLCCFAAAAQVSTKVTE